MLMSTRVAGEFKHLFFHLIIVMIFHSWPENISPAAKKTFLIFVFIHRWFSHCLHANLNGRYNLGLTWYDLSRNEWVAVKNTIMIITKRHECLSPSEDLYDSSSSETNDSSPTLTTRSPI